MKTISVIIPCYNEEESLPFLYDRLSTVLNGLSNYNSEMLFVNDGSRDRTLEIIKSYKEKDNRIAYVNLSRNFGKEIAMAAALDYVTGDAVIIIDADLQDPPELIHEMVTEWENGYDDVYAKRRSRKGETFFKKFTSKAFYRVLKMMSKVPIQEDAGDFRLLSRRAVDALNQIKEKQRYTKGMFSWIGFKKKEIYFDRDPRIAGTTKWNYVKLMDLAIEGITSFTTAPLRVASFFGIMLSFFSFCYMIFVVIKAFVVGDPVQGYPSLVSIILFLGGIQLLALGIIGEYLGRVFYEVKDRPLYLIDEYVSSEFEEEQ